MNKRGHWGRVLIRYDCGLTGGGRDYSLFSPRLQACMEERPREDPEQGEGGCLQTRKRGLIRIQPRWHLLLDLASRTVSNTFLFEQPSLWCVAMAA